MGIRNITFDPKGYEHFRDSWNSLPVKTKFIGDPHKNVGWYRVESGWQYIHPWVTFDVEVDLGTEYIVDGVSFDRYYSYQESWANGHKIQLNFLDEDRNFTNIYLLFENTSSANNGQWVTEEPSFTAMSNVRYVQVRWEFIVFNDIGDPSVDLQYPIDMFLDNIQISDQGLSGYPAPNHTGLAACPCNNASGGEPASRHPISLRTGEKYEEVTDLSVQSAAGALSFTRAYRQSKLIDDYFTFMGLGWQHNHNINLTEDTLATPHTIVVRFTNGGETFFTEQSTNYYEGDAGSVSTITKDGGTGEFTLVTADKSIYLFDSDGKLLSHIWPNNETWTYTYTSDRLTEVADDYERSLQFSYIDDPGQYDDGQLWRVGDHTATDLDSSAPTGRYIEFGYAPEKVDGIVVGTPGALLVSVQDVRGNIWTYDYFGQHSDETDTDQLNFLSQVTSPSVDTNGDGTVDGTIQLKHLTYTTSSGTITNITQELGIQDSEPALLVIDLAFQPSAQNITTETIAGKVTTHHFAQDMYAGTEDPAGNSTQQGTDSQYRPTLQRDANGNAVILNWSSNGKFLTHVRDPLNHEIQFDYNTSGDSADTLNYSVDAEGRKTQYDYADSGNPRLPTRIQVLDTDGTTVLRWQEIAYDSYGRVLTETVLDPDDGVTVLQQTTRTYGSSGYGAGLLESVTVEDPLVSGNNTATTYTYDVFGRVIETQQSSLLGTCQFSYTVYDEAGNVVATVCGRQSTTPPTTINEAIAMYDADDDVMKDNRVTTHEYDSLGRHIKTTTNDGADFAQTNLTVYDALNRVIRTISNYVADVGLTNPYTAAPTAFDHGSDNTTNLVTDTFYNARGSIRKQVDVLGHATLFGYDDAGHLVKTIQNASDVDYNNDYVGTSPDPTLASYSEDSALDTDIMTLQAYDAVGNLVKIVDPLGRVSYTVYDEMNRPVKTVRAAKGDATLDLNLGDMDYNAANDPRSEGYEISPDPDRDLIDLTEYDTMGRVIRTQHLLENRPIARWETTLFGFDALGRQVRVIRNASKPAYDVATDPSLAVYSINPDPDKDIVTQTVYEASGRVQYTEDALGSKTWIAYDGLGRQIKTIANAVGSDTDDGEHDPRSDSYLVNSDADKDLITTTIYDSDGRVQSTIDVLERISYNVYDASGRLFRTITNYVDQDSTNPFCWVWNTDNHRWEYADDNDTAVNHGTDNDQNIITETVYDLQGRVSQTLDSRHNTTHYVYDRLGRRVKTITNYIEQGSSLPENWEWSAIHTQWEDGDSNAIDFGDDHDQNRISSTTYDLGGRVSQIRDAAGIDTRYEYDALGRRITTTINYVDGSFDEGYPDEDLISTTTYNKVGQVVSTTDTRETETAFTYDHAGRRLTVTRAATTDLAIVDYTCYDKAGRVLRTIQNWTNTESAASPDAKGTHGNWSFVPENHGSYNDRDLVTSYFLDGVGRPAQIVDALGNETLMRYDKAGQLIWQSDPTYSVTRFVYDQAHRRRRVVQGYLPIPLDEKIVYFSYPSTDYEVFTMTPEGSDQTNLSDAAGQDNQPHWSPDDSQIVFVSDRAGVSPSYFYDVYIMDADGGNQQRLTDLSGYATEPAWSPDGGQIVFAFKPNSLTVKFDLYVMNTDGSNLRVLFTDPYITASRPKWSPDGQRVVFYGSDNDYATSNIYVIHTDGTQLVNLTNGSDRVNQYPSWLWDGSKIAFQTSQDGDQEIYIMNVDGTHPVNISQYSGSNDYMPDWSPDGSRIVFYSKRDTPNREIYVMDADGSSQTRLTTDTNYNQAPIWSKRVVDPASWSWNGSIEDWEDPDSNIIPHGVDNDRNIIVDVTYDKAGRVVEQREPLGNLTAYEYDNLNRRKTLTNPLSKTWSTAYTDLTGGKSRVTLTYPGITGSANYPVTRDFDRLGRLQNIQFGAPSVTPDVVMTYDDAGNRAKMSEYSGASFTSRNRETQFSYDKVHRLKQAAFDTDGNGTLDESVAYEYDAGGLRTKLTLPGSLNVIYTYDQRGQLLSLTDWDSQKTQFAYDHVGRHIATERANRLRSRYQFDAAGRLRVLRHSKDFQTLAHFEYQVDKRGNRIQALEALANPTTASNTSIASTDKGLLLTGTWSDVSGYKENTQATASLKLMFFGNEATLSMGQGSDHSIYDVYINGTLWQSFDGYAITAAQRDIVVTTDVDGRKLQSEGPHLLEIRNRAEKNPNSSGYKVRFKQLTVAALTWTQQIIGYSYDKLSRLKEARYNPGVSGAALDADLLRRYLYTYDRAGNRTQQSVAVSGGLPTVTNYTSYNGINQVGEVNGVVMTYDANGNMTSDGVNSYTWDRANRLLTWDNGVAADLVNHTYDGEGRRVSQAVGTTSPAITKYLLDIQPGLAVVLSQTEGSDVTRFVHAPRGIHARQDASNDWHWTVQDGLGTVRVETDNSVAVEGSQNLDPFGNLIDLNGTIDTPYGFTGELVDGSGLLDLRARRYNAGIGTFASLDPFEGGCDRAMSLNGYSWVEGNVPNWTDPSGRQGGEICYQIGAGDPYTETVAGACSTIAGVGYLLEHGEQASRDLKNFISSVEQVFTYHAKLGEGSGIQFYTRREDGLVYWPNQSIPLSQPDLDLLQKTIGAGVRPTPLPIPDGGTNQGDAGSLGLSSDIWNSILSLCNAIGGVTDKVDTIPKKRHHISLALNENLFLFKFTFNLNVLLNPFNIFVHPYQDMSMAGMVNNELQVLEVSGWRQSGLTNQSTLGNFSGAFDEAAQNAEIIHFNLEGTLATGNYSSYTQFINSAPHEFSGYNVTATELYKIKNNPKLCGKTLFYEKGSALPLVPSMGASIEICGQSPVPFAPGG